MEHKYTAIKPVIIAVSLLLLGACASKMTVSEAPVDETAMEATEQAAEQPAEQTKEANQVIEVIPLDAPATEPVAETGTAATAPAEDAQQTAVKNEEAPAAPQEAISAPDISGITKRFIDHRNTLWHSRDKTYQLYVGDQFATAYSPDSKTLTIASDEPGSNIECKYTMDGKLDPQQASQKNACTALIKKLENYISN